MADSADGLPRGRRTLSAFQAELARRLADAARRPVQPGWLGVGWRGLEVLIPLTQAGEIVHPLPLRPLPHAQPWVRGVAAVRGAVLAVVDWADALGLPAHDPPTGVHEPTYWLTLTPSAGLPFALCVDELRGLWGATQLQPVPPPPPWARAWQDGEGRVRPQLDLALMADRLAASGLHQPAWDQPRRMHHA